MSDKKQGEAGNPVYRLLDSVDYLLKDEKERKLRAKLGNTIKDCIFTDDILTMLNEGDFSGLADGQEEYVFLFSMLFPVIVNDNGISFRLHRHKIEVNLTEASRDRYIYSFSEGRLTSGIFDSYRLYDDEYVRVITQIIKVFPLLKNAISDSYGDFKEKGYNHRERIQHFRTKEIKAEENFDYLISEIGKQSNI